MVCGGKVKEKKKVQENTGICWRKNTLLFFATFCWIRCGVVIVVVDRYGKVCIFLQLSFPTCRLGKREKV